MKLHEKTHNILQVIDQTHKFLDNFVDDTSSTKIAVAVSGGVDSMCLTYIVNEWCKKNKYELTALTVDHHLRQESTKEAKKVSTWLSQLDIKHHVLNWTPHPRKSNIQATARIARYALLIDWCVKNHTPTLLLAHTADDQYETIIMRLSHHTGPLGLAGIPYKSSLGEINILRPFLKIEKAELIEMMQQWNASWIEDPSNEKRIFTRVQVRQDRSTYESIGLSSKSIFKLQHKMGLYRESLEKEALGWIKNNINFYPEGYIKFHETSFKSLSSELKELILKSLLNFISGKIYTPSNKTLNSSLLHMESSQFKAHACHGCYIQKLKNNFVISREESAIEKVNEVSNRTQKWDNRFEILLGGNKLPNNLSIKPLGEKWLELKDNDKMKTLPPSVRRTIPSIWLKEQLIIVPHMDYYVSSGKNMTCQVSYSPILDLCRSRFIID